MALVMNRSDAFPIGTVVKAYPLSMERSRRTKPPGAELASATVDATGKLTFPTLAKGNYTLFAEVAGAPVVMHGGSEDFTPPGPLKERLGARRTAVGAAL